MKILIFYCAILCALPQIMSTPLPTLTGKEGDNQEKLDNKTIAELVQKQTDTIKQIISSQNQDLRREYPVLIKHDSHSAQQTHEKEATSEEDLQTKCQHYLKIFNLTKENDELRSESRTSSSTHRPFNPQIRPIYLQDRNRGTTKPHTTQTPSSQTTSKPGNGFYITQSTTKKPTIQSQTLPQNIKLIKLEPVILQKTILNDGRIIYYWHKSLPSTVQYPQMQHSYYDINKPNMENYEANKHSTYYPNPNTYYNTLSTTTTTTTTPSNSGLSFRNYFPFYWSSSSNDEAKSESTTKASTISSTTPKPIAETNEDLLYAHQLRFVVPVPYEDTENVTKYLWDFDQHAYYPKPMQPTTVNVQVPYVPTFHMIKALTIPNKYITGENSNDYNNYYQKQQ